MRLLFIFMLCSVRLSLGAFGGISPIQVITAADTSLRVTLPAKGQQVSITVTGKVGAFITLGSTGCRAKDTTATAANQNVFLPIGTTNYVRDRLSATCFAVVRGHADSAATVRVETGWGAP